MAPLNVFCVVLILVGFEGIECYPGGAPSSACVYLLPLHGYPNILAQSSPSPYTLHMSAGTYIPGQELEVAIKAETSPFNGWLLQVRRVDTNMTVGRFISEPDGAKLVSCNGQNNAITHSNSYSFPNNTLIAKWLAPDTDVGDIILVGTVLKDYSTFWGPLTSNHVSPTPPQPSTTTTTTTEPTTATPSSTTTQTAPVTTTSPTTTIPTTTNSTISQSESSSTTSSTPSTSVPAQPTTSSTVQPTTSPTAQPTSSTVQPAISSTAQTAISSTAQPTTVKIISTQTTTRKPTTTQPTTTTSTSTQPTTATSSQPSTTQTTVKIDQTTTATRVSSSTTKEEIPVSVTSNIPRRPTTQSSTSDDSGEEVDSDNAGNSASTPDSILSVYIILSLLSLSYTHTLFI